MRREHQQSVISRVAPPPSDGTSRIGNGGQATKMTGSNFARAGALSIVVTAVAKETRFPPCIPLFLSLCVFAFDSTFVQPLFLQPAQPWILRATSALATED